MNAFITAIVSKLESDNKFYSFYRNVDFEVEDQINFFDFKAERKGNLASLLVVYSQSENLIAFQYTYKNTKDTIFYILQDLDLKPSTGGGFTEIYLAKYVHQLQLETKSEITLADINMAEELFVWKEQVKKDIFAMKQTQLDSSATNRK